MANARGDFYRHCTRPSLEFLANDFDAVRMAVANVPIIEQHFDVLRIVAHSANNTLATVAGVLCELDALASFELLSIGAFDIGVRHLCGLSFPS